MEKEVKESNLEVAECTRKKALRLLETWLKELDENNKNNLRRK